MLGLAPQSNTSGHRYLRVTRASANRALSVSQDRNVPATIDSLCLMVLFLSSIEHKQNKRYSLFSKSPSGLIGGKNGGLRRSEDEKGRRSVEVEQPSSESQKSGQYDSINSR